MMQLFPYDFPFAVFFLCVLPVFCATAFCVFSCAFTKVGAFSHGFVLCTTSCLCDVISFAANGCVRGMPYLSRYAFPSSPCSFRCLTDSCLKLTPHARHVTWCLVM